LRNGGEQRIRGRIHTAWGSLAAAVAVVIANA
jgi:hypothetical protein